MLKPPQHMVHPIVHRALELARRSPLGDLIFDEFAIAELRDMLEATYGKPELRDAVVDLINLAGELEKMKSQPGAIAIITLVATSADALQELTKRQTENPK